MNMLTNFFTLKHLSREFHSSLAGSTVASVYSQEKNTLIYTFQTPRGDEPALCVSVDPEQTYACVSRSMRRSRRNSVDLFLSLTGLKLISVELPTRDRLIVFSFSDSTRLILRLYGTAANNIFHVNAEGTVRDAFKRKTVLAGKKDPAFAPGGAREDPGAVPSEDDFVHSFTLERSGTPVAIVRRLKDVVPLLGKIYVRELLHRTEIPESAQELPEIRIRDLHAGLRGLLKELDDPHPMLFREPAGAYDLSLVSLTWCRECERLPFPSVNDAVEECVRMGHGKEREDSGREQLLASLRSELARRERSHLALGKELEKAGRWEAFARTGTLIMTNLHLLRAGMKEADVLRTDDQMRTEKIALDPALTPVRNAERYFRQAKELKSSLAQTGRKFRESAARIAHLREMIQQLEAGEASDGLKKFRTIYKKELAAMNVTPASSSAPAVPFRVFTVSGGYEVWVGKSSAQNDLLTMKFAKPHDLWFHARGASGSHTLLRRRGKDPVPREAVRDAAAIAAYYSKMRNASAVPVAWCERKYVRKPKGAPSGTVTIEREEVIFVSPGLPAGAI